MGQESSTAYWEVAYVGRTCAPYTGRGCGALMHRYWTRMSCVPLGTLFLFYLIYHSPAEPFGRNYALEVTIAAFALFFMVCGACFRWLPRRLMCLPPPLAADATLMGPDWVATAEQGRFGVAEVRGRHYWAGKSTPTNTRYVQPRARDNYSYGL